MKRFMLLVLLSCLGCSSNLSKSKAKELLEAEATKSNSTWCQWSQALQAKSAADSAYIASFSCTQVCADGLEAAKIARVRITDECRVEPLENGKVDRAAFLYKCGTWSAGEVTSVTTENKDAYVRFLRTIVLDKRTADLLANCKVKTPEPGEAQAKARFSKNDDGEWRLAYID